MANKKEMEALVKDLRKAGFVVELAKNGHYKVSRDGLSMGMAKTPGDYRGIKNTLVRLKRKFGYDPKSN